MKTTSLLMLMISMLFSIIVHGQGEAKILMSEPIKLRSVFEAKKSDVVGGYITIIFMGATDRPVPFLLLRAGGKVPVSTGFTKEAAISLQEFLAVLDNSKATLNSIPDSTVFPSPLLGIHYDVELKDKTAIKNDFTLYSISQGDAFYEALLGAVDKDSEAYTIIKGQASSVLPPMPEAKISEKEAIDIAQKDAGFLGTWTDAQRKRDGWHIRSHSKSANPPNLFIIDAMTGKILYKNMNTDEVN